MQSASRSRGHARGDRARRRGGARSASRIRTSSGAPVEREPPGERLVEHDADARTSRPRARPSASVACSGAMYAGVPDDLAVDRRALGHLARRARSRAARRGPPGVTRTFDGLMSRWTLPAAWSAASPRASCGERRAQPRLVERIARRSALGAMAARRNCIGRVVDAGARPRRRSSTDDATPLGCHRRAGPHVGEEVDALDELHREEPLLALADELAEGDEVGVVQVLERAELVLEAEQGLALRPGARSGASVFSATRALRSRSNAS